MSLVFCDGFDDGLTLNGKWTVGGSPTMTTGRNGSGGVRFGSSAALLTKQWAAADEHATFVVGCAFQVSAFNTTNNALLALKSDNAATTHLSVCVTTGGALEVRRGAAGGTLLGTASQSVAVSTWYYLEIKAALHDTTGSVELRLNEATVLNLTDVDTRNGGTKTVFDSLTFGGSNSSATFVDDVYVCNGAAGLPNDVLGDTSIFAIYPDTNGSVSQWVGSDGNSVDNYLLVDETTPSATDYTESDVVGNRDMYGMADSVRRGGAVRGIVASHYVANSDANPRSVRPALKSGATLVYGGTAALGTTYSVVQSVHGTDPATGAAWTVAGVNAVEAGVEVAA